MLKSRYIRKAIKRQLQEFINLSWFYILITILLLLLINK